MDILCPSDYEVADTENLPEVTTSGASEFNTHSMERVYNDRVHLTPRKKVSHEPYESDFAIERKRISINYVRFKARISEDELDVVLDAFMDGEEPWVT
jgi:hypothetical protein